MTRLTEHQRAILAFLDGEPDGQSTPTKIGIEVGKRQYDQASPWACKRLKPLVARELVKRYPGGRYEISNYGVLALNEEPPE